MLPAAVVLVVAVMVIPLPSAVLDVLIVANLSTAILILLVSMNVKQALEFSSFPSLLLVVTLLRLGLNVATSRAVLSKGHAGDVIATFGSVVVGGSLVVGLVIFLDPHARAVRRHLQRFGSRGRGDRPVHPRRDARQADGDRRRPVRRHHRRERRPPAPQGGR
jgi:hypothetical protein